VIVDASVAVKWLIPEIHADAATRLLTDEYQRLAPELAVFECADALRKRTRQGDLQPIDASSMVNELMQLLTVQPTAHLATVAFDLAVTFGRRVYDTLYAALALQGDCVLVTADRPLYDALSPSMPGNMLWIEDVPQTDAG